MNSSCPVMEDLLRGLNQDTRKIIGCAPHFTSNSRVGDGIFTVLCGIWSSCPKCVNAQTQRTSKLDTYQESLDVGNCHDFVTCKLPVQSEQKKKIREKLTKLQSCNITPWNLNWESLPGMHANYWQQKQPSHHRHNSSLAYAKLFWLITLNSGGYQRCNAVSLLDGEHWLGIGLLLSIWRKIWLSPSRSLAGTTTNKTLSPFPGLSLFNPSTIECRIRCSGILIAIIESNSGKQFDCMIIVNA